MKIRWPLLIYYAVKHWPIDYLTVDATYPHFLTDQMVRIALNPVTRKAAKLALVALSRKFKKPIGTVTHWDKHWVRDDDYE